MSYSPPSGYDITQTPQFTPEMMSLFQDLLGKVQPGASSGLDYLSKLAKGDENIFKQIEAPAYRALEQGLAQTANRFSGVGAQDSSAFANAQAGQVGQFAQDLAAKRQNLMQGAIDKLLSQSQSLLGQKPYEYQLQESGLDWESMVKIFGPLLISMISGNPAPAALAIPEATQALTRGPTGKMIG